MLIRYVTLRPMTVDPLTLKVRDNGGYKGMEGRGWTSWVSNL